jgi:hypothetical protein
MEKDFSSTLQRVPSYQVSVSTLTSIGLAVFMFLSNSVGGLNCPVPLTILYNIGF